MSLTTSSLVELARRLHLPTSTVDRWIRQGRMPARRRGSLCLFDERELATWARDHKLDLLETANADTAPAVAPADQVSLIACLRRGRVVHDLPGHDVPSLFAALATVAPVGDEHRSELAERLLEREELSPTAIGRGIALPHPRTPLAGIVTEPSVTVCFLAHEVPMAALDGRPVWLALLILSPGVKAHLRVLARLAHWLRDDAVVTVLAGRPAASEVLALVEDFEAAWPPLGAA